MEKIEIRDGQKYWLLQVEADGVFGRVSRDTNYREHALKAGGPRYVLLEDDRGMFSQALGSAISQLWLRIGRMSREVPGALRHSEEVTVMRLAVGDGHDDNMLPALGGFVDDFVDACVLREWYKRNGLSDGWAACEADAAAALRNILTVVHYRKKAVRRPVGPVF